MCDAPEQEPTPLPYLSSHHHATLDIHMQAFIRPQGSPSAFQTSRCNFRDVYWTFEQMVAHHTLGGCNIRAGDIIASGTVSSPAPPAGDAIDDRPQTKGCLLELTENGKTAVQLEPGMERRWLEDGDAVEMRAWCQAASIRIGFGTCDMLLLPPHTCSDSM